MDSRKTPHKYVNLYWSAYRGFTPDLQMRAVFYYMLAAICNIVDVFILTSLVSSDDSDFNKQSLIGWYLLNNLVCIWVKCQIEHINRVAADSMNNQMEKDSLEEFLQCTMESQDKNRAEYKSYSDAARRTVAVLFIYVPIVLYTFVQTLASLIYSTIFLGNKSTIIIVPLAATGVFAYFFAIKFVPKIVEKYQTVADRVELLRKFVRYADSALMDLCLHSQEKSTVNKLIEINHSVEKLWSEASVFGYILTHGVAWAVVNIIIVITIYVAVGYGNFVYATWKLYQDLQTLLHSILRYYGDYMRNIRHVYEYNKFRGKYIFSRRSEVTKHDSVKQIILKDLKFSRNGNGFSIEKLQNSPPIVIDMDKTKLVLVTGDNGQGKTTFSKILSGEIETMEKLNITVDGSKEPDGFLTLTDWRTIVTQIDSVNFRDTSWFDYVTNYADTSSTNEERVKKLLNVTRLTKLIDSQYGGNIHATIDNLSGGERRRVTIARALFRCNKPQMLFLDEGDAGVDSNFPHIINDIKSKHPGGTIFITLMNMSYAKKINIDEHIHFQDGKFGLVADVKTQ